jgi:thiopeptide-type bacteriocin biosynthesis protein
MNVSEKRGHRWLSYHLFLRGEDMDVFIGSYLRSMVDDERKQGRIRRFFFIRYSIGGLHVRARFLLDRCGTRDSIEDGLYRCAANFREGAEQARLGCRIERTNYDRAEHYFGHNPRTVYSELLNEQTSYVALQMLRTTFVNRQIRVLITACVLSSWMKLTYTQVADQARLLEEAQQFVQRALSQLGRRHVVLSPAHRLAFVRSIRRIELKVSDAAGEWQIEKISRLFRRTLDAPGGRVVAIHGLHLFCNKMGVTLQEEGYIYRGLEAYVEYETPLAFGGN